MGAELAKIDEDTKDRLNISNGLKIKNLEDGKLKKAGIREGFVIVAVNKNPVNNVDDFNRVLGQSHGGVLIEGIYPNGERAYYVFGID